MTSTLKVCECDYPDFTFDVVSPELPCGAAWLANCFLELDIPVWRPWNCEVKDEWRRLSPFRYKYHARQQPWKQNLPALQFGREYQFNPEHAASFRHQWPLSPDLERPLILFVRDPRDALYSYWRRTAHNETAFSFSFEEFVQSRYHHHPFNFREYPFLFLKKWKEFLQGYDHIIIRFEDYRANAQRTLREVLDYLNIKVDDDQVSRGLAASDFSIVKRIEDHLERKGELEERWNHAGVAFEYQKSYSPAMHDCIGAEFNEIYEWLGYATHENARSQSREHKLTSIRRTTQINGIDLSGMPIDAGSTTKMGVLHQLNVFRHFIHSLTK